MRSWIIFGHFTLVRKYPPVWNHWVLYRSFGQINSHTFTYWIDMVRFVRLNMVTGNCWINDVLDLNCTSLTVDRSSNDLSTQKSYLLSRFCLAFNPVYGTFIDRSRNCSRFTRSLCWKLSLIFKTMCLKTFLLCFVIVLKWRHHHFEFVIYLIIFLITTVMKFIKFPYEFFLSQPPFMFLYICRVSFCCVSLCTVTDMM